MEKLFVIKIGSNVIDKEVKLTSFLQHFSAIEAKKILVHGGGSMATSIAANLGIKQNMIDGRRITDIETLKIVTMVYAGYINKNIVATLQANSCNAIGLTGADANIIKAHKRSGTAIDYGFVGDIDKVNSGFIQELLKQGLSPVIAPITHDNNGTLLNTNADTIAQEIAQSMSELYDISLIYCLNRAGVLKDINDDNSVIQKIDPKSYAELKKADIINSGMLPKLENAFAALDKGVNKIVIGKAEDLIQLINQQAGTAIVH